MHHDDLLPVISRIVNLPLNDTVSANFKSVFLDPIMKNLLIIRCTKTLDQFETFMQFVSKATEKILLKQRNCTYRIHNDILLAIAINSNKVELLVLRTGPIICL